MTLDEAADEIVNTPGLWRELTDLRGGCQCPLGYPPCYACSEPLTEQEAEKLGFELGPAYLSITRALCR